MNRNDVTAILRKRLEFLELIGNPYPYQDEEIKLLAGDNILMKIVPGWTTRECIATCHLHLVDNKDIYMVDYWLAEWSGTPNLAKERGMKLAEKRNQEEEAVSKDYDEIYGPPAACRTKTYKNFSTSDQAGEDKLGEIFDWPFKYPSKDNDEAICWGDSGTYYLNLILAGPPGMGKTHLACALYYERRGHTFWGAEFIRAEDLVRKFKKKEQKESILFRRYGDGIVEEKNKMDRGCELLVIDDLGVDKSPYARQILTEVIYRRNAAGLCTVITTNLSKPELSAMLGDRGASRLFHRCLAKGMGALMATQTPPPLATSNSPT